MSPDRRLAPRPLPAHLASATMLWLSSRAGWTAWKSALPVSSAIADRAAALAAEIARCGPAPVGHALDAEIGRRAATFLAGLEAYRQHPYRRPASRRRVLWREGTTRLLDCGRDGAPPVVVVPSLVNRFYILDLLPERSFLRFLAAQGLRPLVVDWGAPGADERDFTVGDYVARLLRAVAVAGERPGLIGYCMGGLLALAAAQSRPGPGALALLATPWDFHAEHRGQARRFGRLAAALAAGSGDGTLPVEVIQFFFFALDPFLAQRKFIRFADLDQESDAARQFVALEDWINDGVPLPAAVASECALSWYRDNAPGTGNWCVGGSPVRPEALTAPVLAVVPGGDRIVPPGSASALAGRLPGAEVLRPPLGHVGMMSAARAPEMLWRPLARWFAYYL